MFVLIVTCQSTLESFYYHNYGLLIVILSLPVWLVVNYILYYIYIIYGETCVMFACWNVVWLEAEIWNGCRKNMDAEMSDAEIWSGCIQNHGMGACWNVAWSHVHMRDFRSRKLCLYWHHPAAGKLEEICKFPASGHMNGISCGMHISGICPEEGNSLIFSVLVCVIFLGKYAVYSNIDTATASSYREKL